MDRRALAMLGVCATLLVSGGTRGISVSATAEPSASEVASAGGFGEAEVREFMHRVNPDLPPARVQRIAVAVIRYSGKYDLSPELVTAVLWRESHARPWARSPKGAVGLMQVMPYMFEPLELAGNLSTVESNIEAGCLILSDNIRRLGEEDGILAYFWGSEIRGASYLDRVQKARDALRGPSRS